MEDPFEFEIDDESSGKSEEPASEEAAPEESKPDETGGSGGAEKSEKPAKPRNRLLTFALAMLAVFTAARIFIAYATPLLAAEAYYWLWSTRPAAGYYDHPPMIAYWIRAGTELIGEIELGVRLLPLLLGTGAIFLFYLLCREMLRDKRAATVGLLFGAFAPFYLPFAIGATPDAPLMFFWTLTLVAFIAGYKRDNAWLWLLAGISVGLTIISKYNGFQLPIILFVFLLLTPRGREYLSGAKPYMALLAAAMVAAPNMIWTLSRGGSTMGIPFRDGLSLEEAATNIGAFATLPFIWLTPLLALAWIGATIRGLFIRERRRDEMFIFGLCAGWLPLLMFAAMAPLNFVHAQWVAPCFVAAAPIMFFSFASKNEGVKKRSGPLFTKIGLGFGCVMIAAALIAPVFIIRFAPLDGEGPVMSHMSKFKEEIHGWDQITDRLNAEIDRLDDGRLFIASTNYHRVSTAAWLTGNRVPALPLRYGERFGQFRYWHEEGMYNGWNALMYEKGEDDEYLDLALELFEEVKKLEPERIRSEDREIRVFSLYECRGFRGLD